MAQTHIIDAAIRQRRQDFASIRNSSNEIAGHAKLFAKPAYEHLLRAEGALKRLIPFLIVAFLLVVAAARILSLTNDRGDLEARLGSATALSAAAAAGSLAAHLEAVSAGDRGRIENVLGNALPADRSDGGMILVADGNGRVFASSALASFLIGNKVSDIVGEQPELLRFGARAGVMPVNYAGDGYLAAMRRLPGGAGSVLVLSPLAAVEERWRSAVSLNVTLFIATSSILIIVLYAYFSQATRAVDADELFWNRTSGWMRRCRAGAAACGTWTWRAGGCSGRASMHEMLGLPPRDCMLSFGEAARLMHPDDNDLYAVARSIANGEIRRRSTRSSACATPTATMCGCVPAPRSSDTTSNQTHLIGIAMDVTEQHRLAQRYCGGRPAPGRRLESTSEAFVLWDKNDRLVHVQFPSISRPTGSREEVLRARHRARGGRGGLPAPDHRAAHRRRRPGRQLRRPAKCSSPTAAGCRSTSAAPATAAWSRSAPRSPCSSATRTVCANPNAADGDDRRPLRLAHGPRTPDQGAFDGQLRLSGREGARRGGQPREIGVPRQHVARAAHAAQRDPRLFRDPGKGHVRAARIGEIRGVCRATSTTAASTCSA